MKVFISWSGEPSKIVARAWKKLLKRVIQAVEPFVSDEDIAAGQQWASVLTKELEATQFGIVCLTPDNLEAP